jgi:hypothetical protein
MGMPIGGYRKMKIPINREPIAVTLLFALILLTPLISANTFGYNYLDNKPTGNITNEYINNTYINQTLELNTTQFETGEPATIKLTWLTSFIESISKWANYLLKGENIDMEAKNITNATYIQTDIINFSGGQIYYNGTDNIWDFR